jgi:hypothetical protein
VLQSDVAQGMGYEWREGREASSPFPAAGTVAGTEPAIGTQAPDMGPPPEGTFDVYLDGTGYLSSITTEHKPGDLIHLAGRVALHVIETNEEGRTVLVRPATDDELASVAQALQDGNTEERPPEGTFDVYRDEADDDRRRGAIDRRSAPYDVAVTDERRSSMVWDRRGPLDIAPHDDNQLTGPGGYELTDMGPGAVAILESLVRWAKRQTRPWRDLSEAHQERELADLDRVITERVRDLVVDVASRNFPYVHATLEKVEFSEGIKATLTISPTSEHRHELADRAKQTVTVVLVGAATWTSGERPKPDPDQQKLV